MNLDKSKETKKRSKKILFISPDMGGISAYRQYHAPPLGVVRLAGYLNSKGKKLHELSAGELADIAKEGIPKYDISFIKDGETVYFVRETSIDADDEWENPRQHCIDVATEKNIR